MWVITSSLINHCWKCSLSVLGVILHRCRKGNIWPSQEDGKYVPHVPQSNSISNSIQNAQEKKLDQWGSHTVTRMGIFPWHKYRSPQAIPWRTGKENVEIFHVAFHIRRENAEYRKFCNSFLIMTLFSTCSVLGLSF